MNHLKFGNHMTRKLQHSGTHASHRQHPLPWLLTQSDCSRYLGRAIRTCLAGRVLLFYTCYKRDEPKVLLAMVRMPDEHGALAAAREDFKRGKFKRVRLANLPPIRQPRFDKDASSERDPEKNNPLAAASAVTRPSYVGWWAAASYHNFTTQKPVAISVASRRRIPVRWIEGTEIRFVKMSARKFFGFSPVDVYGSAAVISTPAKTVIDCIDRPSLAGGPSEVTRIVFGASSTLDPDEVVETALEMKSGALLQRLGFLMDLICWKPSEEARAKMRAAIPLKARSFFGRGKSQHDDIGYVAEWGLSVRRSGASLLADVPTAQALLAK